MITTNRQQPVIAIDPGDQQSAYTVYDNGKIIESKKLDNEELLQILSATTVPKVMAIEAMQSFGMAVGQTVFETCEWVGRFIEVWQPKPYKKVYRKDVKRHLCNSHKAKDKNINCVLWDRYGGSRQAAVGTIKNPGPCFGMAKDQWSSLAIAITYCEYEFEE